MVEGTHLPCEDEKIFHFVWWAASFDLILCLCTLLIIPKNPLSKRGGFRGALAFSSVYISDICTTSNAVSQIVFGHDLRGSVCVCMS